MELSAVLAILTILASILLPAVQAVRERSRQTDCANNLRQLALAAQMFESAQRELPGMYFSSHPNGRRPHNEDRGLFVEMLPYLEQSAIYASMSSNGQQIGNTANFRSLTSMPATLACPSSPQPQLLHRVPDRFNGPGVEGSKAAISDYAGNGGVGIWNGNDQEVKIGSITPRIGKVSRRRLSRIQDGLSNTLLFWDSSGSVLRFRRGGPETAFGEEVPRHFKFYANRASGSVDRIVDPIVINNRETARLYVYSWVGFRAGTIVAKRQAGSAGRASVFSWASVNAGNQLCQPFSFHASGVNVALVDGSTRFLSENLDPSVLVGLSTADESEITSSEAL